MPSSFRLAPSLCVLAFACLAGSVSAQPAGAVPALQPQGAGRWVCGGIGSDESTAFRAAMKQHPLSLLFARASGDYLADVQVTVKNAQGADALSGTARGPVCLIDLPAGRYTVEATVEGKTQRHTVTVGGTPATADFRF
ncbi:carboxypeptidase-like regulatory domain-containing protein [uncultured Xylophilus sp.]|uniref:carboxypeptidase-like regulatory domain-containing protein n=1 Tax=uncultured Xylophilus sp. TaxID=296832 RepID=UPI0025DA5C34|nr:carboxypeptidase-like regulatory domain-containing protein [uncultured Xylophilus sp.]